MKDTRPIPADPAPATDLQLLAACVEDVRMRLRQAGLPADSEILLTNIVRRANDEGGSCGGWLAALDHFDRILAIDAGQAEATAARAAVRLLGAWDLRRRGLSGSRLARLARGELDLLVERTPGWSAARTLKDLAARWSGPMESAPPNR